MSLHPITAPATEPISLADVKTRLVIDHDLHDAFIESLIVAARENAEQLLGRALITQTWECVEHSFPCGGALKLAMPPQIAIVSVKYTDTAGDEQTLDPAVYALDAINMPGFLRLAYGSSWPSTQCIANAVRVRFTAGYGAAAESVPESIRNWMHLHVGEWYCNRKASSDKHHELLPYTERLLDRWKVWA